MPWHEGDKSEHDRRLDEVVTAYLREIEAGKTPNSAEWLARYPELAAELGDFFAAQEQVGRLAAPLRVTPPVAGADAPTTGLGDRAADVPVIGTRIQYFGDYELLQEIGRGGMGVVYKARQVSLNRVVALKMILTGQLANEDDVRRFYAEAKAAANLQHDGIVPVFEVGEYERHHYFTMAFIEGQSLAQKLTEGMLPPRQAAELVKKIAKAVSYAHTEGVIHRDLKPANILLDKNGEPRLTDFGLAKRVGSGQLADGSKDGSLPTADCQVPTALTATGQILGTPSYMPPEQASGKKGGVGPLADVYSLGAILYCLLTGRPPFQADNPFDTLMQVVEQEPASPRSLNAKVPRDLETICLKCLEKEPGKRYASASALAEDLDRYLSSRPIEARPVGSVERSWKWAKRRPAVAMLSVAVVLMAIVANAVGIIFGERANRLSHDLKIKNDEAIKHLLALEKAQREANVDREAARIAREEAARDRLAAKEDREKLDIAARRIGKDVYVGQLRLAQQAWDESRMFRMHELLDSQLPEKTADVDLRGFEWHYLKRLSRTELFSIPSGGIGVAYSPDGKLIASSGYNRVLILSDAATGKKIFELKGHGGLVVWTAVFSPDSKRLASCTGEFGSQSDKGEVKIWDVSTGELLLDLKGHPSAVNGLSFSPDGKRLASCSSDKTLRIWDTTTGDEVFKLEHKNQINGVAFLHDGEHLAYVDQFTTQAGNSEGDLRILELATRKDVLAQPGNAGRLFGVTISTDDKLFAASGDLGLRVWSLADGKQTLSMQAGTARNSGLSFSKDGKRLAGCYGSIVKVWETATGRELHSFNGHGGGIVSVAFSPDGQRVASADGSVKVWDLAQSQEPLTIKSEGGWWFGGAAFSPDGKQLAVGNGNGPVQLLDPATGKVLRVLKGHARWVRSCAFNSDGDRLVTASEDGIVKLWNVATGEAIHTIDGFAHGVNGVTFSPDGKTIATAEGSNEQKTVGKVKLWDAATAKFVREYKVATADATRPWITSVAFSPDGKWLTAGATQHARPDDRTIEKWKFYSGAIVVWDTATGKEIAFLPDNHHVHSVAFSKDGTRVASASLVGTLKLWNTENWMERFTLKGHAGDAEGVAFSPDGKRLASTSRDGTVRIWDTATGQEVFVLRGDVMMSVAFSPDGHRLAATGPTLRIWDATPRE